MGRLIDGWMADATYLQASLDPKKIKKRKGVGGGRALDRGLFINADVHTMFWVPVTSYTHPTQYESSL